MANPKTCDKCITSLCTIVQTFGDIDHCEQLASHFNSQSSKDYYRCVKSGKRKEVKELTFRGPKTTIMYEANLWVCPKRE
jgi:hypothetical protein